MSENLEGVLERRKDGTFQRKYNPGFELGLEVYRYMFYREKFLCPSVWMVDSEESLRRALERSYRDLFIRRGATKKALASGVMDPIVEAKIAEFMETYADAVAELKLTQK